MGHFELTFERLTQSVLQTREARSKSNGAAAATSSNGFALPNVSFPSQMEMANEEIARERRAREAVELAREAVASEARAPPRPLPAPPGCLRAAPRWPLALAPGSCAAAG